MFIMRFLAELNNGPQETWWGSRRDLQLEKQVYFLISASGWFFFIERAKTLLSMWNIIN